MARRTGSRRSFLPLMHRGSGMKARPPEAAGGKPGPAGRSGHASFSGPSSRTKAKDAAGAGAFVSGALGAALLAAALLLAPGEARAQTDSCGTPDANGALSCADQTWTNILHTMGASAAALSLTVGGGPATMITATQNNSGISLDAVFAGATGNQTLTVGNVGAVAIMPGSGATVTTGISLRQRGSGTARGDIRGSVTIGSESNPIATGVSAQARGAGGFSLTSAATIHATTAGLFLWRPEASTNDPAATSIENSGAITTSGSGDGIRVEYQTPSATTQTGTLTIANSGTITVTGNGQGIRLNPVPGVLNPIGFNPHGDLMVTNSGTITASATDGDGIDVAYSQGNTASSGDIAITNSGVITANRYGIHVDNHGGGDLKLTNTNTGDIASANDHAIFARARQGGDIAIDSSGDLSAAGADMRGIMARSDGDGDVTVRATGGEIASASAEGIHVRSDGMGALGISSASDVSARTGVLAEVARKSAAGETRAAQPLIDVTWTGTFPGDPAKTAENDVGRFPVIALDETGVKQHRGAVIGDKVVIRGKEVDVTHRYGEAAGIEARAMDLDALLATVAKGDDPGPLMVVRAQEDLLAVPRPGESAPTDDARARADAIVSQFREMLGNEDLAVAPAVLTAIGSTATTAAELTKAEIVTYLTEDDDDRRTFLRNLLLHGLSEGEKVVLWALTTGGNLEEALGALPDTAAGIAWKGEVRPLLNNHNVGDIRIAVNGGSIDSRGDGIRAYYVTPHDMNGGISVTVAKGAAVTGAMAGVYVANAGEGLMVEKKYTYGYAKADENRADDLVAVMHGEGADAVPLRNQLVTVAGTVTGGTDAAVHLSGGGAVIVEEGGKVHAGSSGVGILVNDPGPALVYIDGEVRGGEGGAAAVRLTGGGSVIVGLNGMVRANGADRTIYGTIPVDDVPTTLVTLVTNGIIMYREDAEEAHARMEGVYHPQSVLNVLFREDRDGVPTGYTRTLPVHRVSGELDTSGLDPRPKPSMDPTDPTNPMDPETDPGAGPGADPEMDPEAGPGAPPPSTFSCAGAIDGRCQLYEALPSMLLAMNAQPSWAERTSAARDGNGGWARVEAAGGDWQAKTATTATPLAYDHRSSAVRAGVDFHAGESARVGVSVHALGGRAEMSDVGEVELDGVGGGLSAIWWAGDLYVDAQATVTLYDVDVESYTHGKMSKKDVYGAGYGLGVDVGRRMGVGGMMVTPRAGVEWSKVELDDFLDMEPAGGPRASVSVEEADSVKGRVGVMMETEVGSGETWGRLFASLDVEREFSDETEVKVGGELLKTEVRPTALRLGLGGEFAVDEAVVVRVTGGYRASGSGTSGYGGGLELQVRF